MRSTQLNESTFINPQLIYLIIIFIYFEYSNNVINPVILINHSKIIITPIKAYKYQFVSKFQTSRACNSLPPVAKQLDVPHREAEKSTYN